MFQTVKGFIFSSVFFFFIQTAQMMKMRMKRTMAMAMAAMMIGMISSPFSTFGMISVGCVDLVTYCLHWTILHTLLWNFHLVSIQVLEINLPRGNQFRKFCHSLLLLPSIQLCGSHKVE